VSEFARALLGVFAAVAPFGAVPVFVDAHVSRVDRPRVIAAMYLVALVLLAAAALVAEPFLDWLDVSPENFQLAAGLIMLPQALQLIWRGRSLTEAGAGTIVPLAAPLLAGPASLAAAMTYATRFGESEAVAASALVLLVAVGLLLAGGWAEVRPGRSILGFAARLNGTLLIIIAIELAVDGVRSV
jgi:multiple antibiotic resistance protein